MTADLSPPTHGFSNAEDWSASPPPAARRADEPLEVLLEEVRRRRVDLSALSMSDIVEACLARVAGLPTVTQKAEQITLAAALTEMKSLLMLRTENDDGEGEAAARLRAQLERLAHAQSAAAALMAQDRLGRDVWARGAPELDREDQAVRPAAALDLLDLVRAYARLQVIDNPAAPFEVRRAFAMTLEEGLDALAVTLPEDGRWIGVAEVMARAPRTGGAPLRSAIASGFAAALELAKRGEAAIADGEDGEAIVRRV